MLCPDIHASGNKRISANQSMPVNDIGQLRFPTAEAIPLVFSHHRNRLSVPNLPLCHNGGGPQTARTAAPNPLKPSPPSTPEPPPLHHPQPHPTTTPCFYHPTKNRPRIPLQSGIRLRRPRRDSDHLLRQPQLSPRQHGHPLRAPADSMDCRADGEVPSDSGAWVGGVDSVLGPHFVC